MPLAAGNQPADDHACPGKGLGVRHRQTYENPLHCHAHHRFRSLYAVRSHVPSPSSRLLDRAADLAMVFKLVESAQARWRAVNGARLGPLVRAGALFGCGRLVEHPEVVAA